MLPFRPFLFCCLVIITLDTSAAAPTKKQLTGTWHFVAWAEKAANGHARTLNIRMDFNLDGTVESYRADGIMKASWRIDGDSIVYTDANGEQRWSVIEFVPGKRMMVEQAGAVLTFERPR